MSRHYLFLASITCITLLAACSQPARQEIAEVREPGATKREAPPKADTKERLGLTSSSAAHGAEGHGAEGHGAEDPLGGITFHHDMPEGWEAIATTDLRQVNLRMTAVPEAECYFTLLPGGGGGLDANLNRWRSQMGLEPLTPEAIAALPKKPIFGQPGTFILIDGTFSGMGGSEPRENYRMYGLMLSHTDPETGRMQGFFLKMTGPKDVLEGQEANFDLIASSLHAVAPGDAHDHGAATDEAHGPNDGHDHGAASTATTAEAAPAGYSWTLPAGWEEKAPGMMRQANLTITGQPDVECYLTVLAGNGGGIDMNINRWQAQMGQPELTAEQIAALPKHPLFGGEAAYVIIDGTFGGMGNTVQKENFRMYGLAVLGETEAYFVKMVGPKDVLAAEEANFLAFCASLQKGAAPAAEVAPAAEATPAATAGNPHGIADPTPEGGFNPEGLKWTAPAGWTDGGEKMMRVVTYISGSSECYITSLSGEAGGVNANINRWVSQMGQQPLDEAALAALPRITVMGKEAPLVETSGNFTDMDGIEKQNYKLLGTVLPVDGQTLFIKMTGPGSEVDAQKENFIAFCASLH